MSLAEQTPRALDGGLALVARSAFWLAALFPVLYLPVLLAGERLPAGDYVLLALVGMHVLLLLAGHRHATTEPSPTARGGENAL